MKPQEEVKEAVVVTLSGAPPKPAAAADEPKTYLAANLINEISAFEKNFAYCKSCHNVLEGPMGCLNVARCGALICKSCSPSVGTCICGGPNEPVGAGHMINALLSTFKFRCSYSEFGCKVEPGYYELKDHQKACEYIADKCPYCPKQMMKKDIPTHLDTCDNAVFSCKTCGGDYLRVEEKTHNCLSHVAKEMVILRNLNAELKIKNEEQESAMESLVKAQEERVEQLLLMIEELRKKDSEREGHLKKLTSELDKDPKRKFANAKSLTRFSSHKSPWMYSDGCWDAITFTPKKAVRILGFSVYKTSSGSQFSCVYQLKVNGTKKEQGKSSNHTISGNFADIPLTDNIELEAEDDFEIAIQMNPSTVQTFYGENGDKWKDIGSNEMDMWEIRSGDMNNNAGEVDKGQIPRLFYEYI